MLRAALITLVITAPQAPTPPAATDRSLVPHCAVSTDPNYGVTPGTPVQVGGGSLSGPTRERRYLDALRGPNGQPVRYKRIGSMQGTDGTTILDAYEVIYDGIVKPTTVYIDEYHFSDVRAPVGFVCGQPIGLSLPPLDSSLVSQALVRVAVEQGTIRDVPPIPLDQDGATTHGVVFDHFRMIARAARAAAAAGTKLDPQNVPADVARPRTIVLAYPLSCDGRTSSPAAIEIVGAQGTQPRREGDYARDGTIGALLPGVQAPVSSLAAAFTLPTLRPGDAVRITYADPACTGGSPELSLAVKFSDVRSVDMSPPSLPFGLTPSDAPVWLQTLVDLDGMLQHPAYIGGPAHLAQAAIEAVQRWRSEPARINGAPIVRPVMIPVRFKP